MHDETTTSATANRTLLPRPASACHRALWRTAAAAASTGGRPALTRVVLAALPGLSALLAWTAPGGAQTVPQNLLYDST
jgi:hypothetical protein